MPLRTRIWEQPKLREGLRFTPRVEFPTPETNIAWASTQQGESARITSHIESLVSCLKNCLRLEVLSAADKALSSEELDSGTAWLTSMPVSDWYHKVSSDTRKAFFKWIMHLYHSMMASLDKAGGLITLSHLVSGSLSLAVW